MGLFDKFKKKKNTKTKDKVSIDQEMSNDKQEDNNLDKIEILKQENQETKSTLKNTAIQEEIIFNISNEIKEYRMNIIKQGDEVDLSFLNTKDKNNDLALPITNEEYLNFNIKLNDIIKDWKNEYIGEGKSKWRLTIIKDSNENSYTGNGNYPNNWNEFMDLIIEYELLYKKNK